VVQPSRQPIKAGPVVKRVVSQRTATSPSQSKAAKPRHACCHTKYDHTHTHINVSNTNHTHKSQQGYSTHTPAQQQTTSTTISNSLGTDGSILSLVGKKPRSCAKQLPEQRPKGQKTLSRRAQAHYSVLDPQHNLCCGTPQQQQTARVTEHDQHASTNMHTTRCTGHTRLAQHAKQASKLMCSSVPHMHPMCWAPGRRAASTKVCKALSEAEKQRQIHSAMQQQLPTHPPSHTANWGGALTGTESHAPTKSTARMQVNGYLWCCMHVFLQAGKEPMLDTLPAAPAR
jgi:hypothetical protein